MKRVRVGAGQGFYGDSVDGALDVAGHGDVGYICCDALAELTMAILQKDRMSRPDSGFVRDLPEFMAALLPVARRQGIRLISNGGGMNPTAAARAVAGVAGRLGMVDLRIGIVDGDDLTDRIEELTGAGTPMSNLDTGESLETVRSRAVFAVAYMGMRPIVECLRQEADVVVTGRVADASLFLAPMVHELGWADDDWDRLAAGVVLGHLMECGAQATGGNFSGDWWNVADPDRIGYPVCDMGADGIAVLSKPPGTGGRVTFDTVKEQLLYEVLDPRRYLNPDVTADFTSAVLRDLGNDRVEVSGVRGMPPPADLKVVLGYLDGWMGVAQIGYSWPDAVAKARAAAATILSLAARAGLEPLEHRVELIGVDSLHGEAAAEPGEVNEVVLRLAARFATEAEAGRFPRLAVPLALNGPPFIGGGTAPQPPRALLGVWPTTVPRQHVTARVRVARAAELA